MADLLVNHERQQLEHLEGLIDDWQRKLREDLEAAFEQGVPDKAYMERFHETARQLSAAVNRSLPPQLDPEAAGEIRARLLDWLTANYRTDDRRPLDVMDQFMVTAEAIRHIVRDALDGHPGCDEEDRRALVAKLDEWLPRISLKDRAALIGISDRQLQRLAKEEGGTPSRRLQLVARLVAILRRAWTPEGVVAWFHRPRHDLDGRPPIDVLDDPAYERTLLGAVRQGRAQHAS